MTCLIELEKIERRKSKKGDLAFGATGAAAETGETAFSQKVKYQ